MRRILSLSASVLSLSLVVLCLPCLAQWDPANGQWGKSAPGDLRIMTWNILDNICSTQPKVEGRNSWTALARIVAGMKPDVLILQEAGDNTGNGTGTGVDSVDELLVTAHLFVDGGYDPFLQVQVSAWVKKYDPALAYPYIFVSAETDGYNRNVVLSRYPFQDLNGDGIATLSDIHYVFADAYAPGGDGGIRGFQFVEIDLPSGIYRGDLVVGNAHLKAGSTTDDKAQRLKASQNVAYWIDYLLNGAGTGQPDPNGKIRDLPAVTDILPDDTAVILGGDWNEDELTNGRKGPAEWLTLAEIAGGTDGTDRDRTDSAYDDAREPFTASRTTKGSSKLDYVAWQDSIAEIRNSWIFNSLSVPSNAFPSEVAGFNGGGAGASVYASDHLPVLADFVLPAPDVTIQLLPHSLTVAQGEKLYFDCAVTNQTPQVLPVQGWVDVFDPDGTPFFSANPKFGPKSFNLQAFASKRKNNIGINVAGTKPPGTGYKVKAYVGIFPDDIWATDEFTFEVTQP